MEEMKEKLKEQETEHKTEHEIEHETVQVEVLDAVQMEEKVKMADEYLARLQRLQADFDNFRRRTQKERDELTDLVTEMVICKFLPVIDNLARAILTAKNASGDAQFITGIEMIQRQLEDVLHKLNVTAINAVGEIFDPQKHEAIMQVQDDSKADDTIVEEFQRGYQLKQRVIRPSMVKVVKN